MAQSFPRPEPIWGYGFTNAFPALTFNQPVAVLAPPGSSNRLFVVERTGTIRVIPDTGSPRLMTFLTLPDTWHQGDEAGLLGLAFHPNYENNGRFFIYRTVKRNGLRCELSEFRVSKSNRDFADPNSEQLILSQPDDLDTHNAGDLKFGPDGYLYLSLGDEKPAFDDLHELPQAIDKGFFAGIIRIDVDNKEGNLAPNPHRAAVGHYRVPRDNPFVGATEFNGFSVQPNEVRTEFYAVGLRNPWRFTFDPGTGEMICADVGDAYFEEINIVEKGGNYGWPYVEGPLNWETDRPANLQAPLYHYAHGLGNLEGKAVIGGLVVESEDLGNLKGRYIFSDFESGNIWALNTRARETNATWLTARRGIASYAVDPRDGGVLAANLLSGRIEKLIYKSPEESGIPAQLSELHAFEDLVTLKPDPTLLPYEIINPLWSDGAAKQRWVSMKGAEGKIRFNATGPWEFPTGAFWVKHFELELTNGVPESRRRLETRFLVKGIDGVYGLSYRWGDSVTNATLLPPYPTNETFVIHDGGIIRTQVWNYPGWEQCRTCHTPKSGGALSFNTYQLNRTTASEGGPTNQLAWLAAHESFETGTEVIPEKLPNLVAMDDPIAPAQHKSRSYLFSNCSHCHQPGNVLGPMWDGRISTPLAQAKIVDGSSYFYPAPMKILSPRSETNSFLLVRAGNRESAFQMPPLATTVIDHVFLESLTNWIANIPDASWKYVDTGTSLAEGVAEQTVNGLRLYGAGTGVTNDSVFYAYRELQGATEFVTRIGSVKVPSPESEAGILLRADMSAGAKFGAVMVKNETITFLARTETGRDATVIGTLPIFGESWLKLLRTKNGISGWCSSNGTEWTPLGAVELSAADPAFIGLFVASARPSVQFAAAEFEATALISVGLQSPSDSPMELPRMVALTPSLTMAPGANVTVSYFADQEAIGTATNAPYGLNWSSRRTGTVELRAVVAGAHGSITSSAVAVEFTAPAAGLWPGKVDAETRGDWQGRYGSEAYLMPGWKTNGTPNVEITVLQAQRPMRRRADDPFGFEGETNRVLTLIPGRPAIEIALKGNDFLPHKVGLYFYDWLGLGATQLVTFYRERLAISDPVTVTCEQGSYMTFIFRGDVTLRIENPRGTAHLSGIFVDPVEPIVAEFVKPVQGIEVVQPGTVEVEITAIAPGREISKVEVKNGDAVLATLEAPPYTTFLSNLFTGDYTLMAHAIGTFGLSAASAPVHIRILPPSPGVAYLGTDTNTLGNWKGRYGGSGSWVVGDALEITPAVAIELENEGAYVFANETDDARALERAGGGFRVAACLVGSPEFTFEVGVRDGREHVVGFYVLDWDNSSRVMDIKVESKTGDILDARQVTSFAGGKYLFWRVRGNVLFRFSARSVNAVVSGFFVDETLAPFDLWRNNQFARGELPGIGPDFERMDFDADGFNNGVEYALGFDARSAEDRPQLRWNFDGRDLVVRVSRRTKTSDMEVRFEESSDLITWQPLTASEETGESEGEISVRRAGVESHRFLRIRATRVP